jgi:hypothetical protein
MIVALVALGTLLALALILQLLIPRIAARRVEARLTEGGGAAEVRVTALPATRLLRNSGDRLAVRGRGLTIGLGGGAPGEREAGLTALDGFDDVDIELVDFRTGPFAIAAFVLERRDRGPYAMACRGTTSVGEIARLGGTVLSGLPGGGLIGSLASGLPGAPLGERELSVEVQLELISEGGRLVAGAGGGSIAGYPVGPAAKAIATAVAQRLEIVP